MAGAEVEDATLANLPGAAAGEDLAAVPPLLEDLRIRLRYVERSAVHLRLRYVEMSGDAFRYRMIRKQRGDVSGLAVGADRREDTGWQLDLQHYRAIFARLLRPIRRQALVRLHDAVVWR